jgi:hypothetical protein
MSKTTIAPITTVPYSNKPISPIVNSGAGVVLGRTAEATQRQATAKANSIKVKQQKEAAQARQLARDNIKLEQADRTALEDTLSTRSQEAVIMLANLPATVASLSAQNQEARPPSPIEVAARRSTDPTYVAPKQRSRGNSVGSTATGPGAESVQSLDDPAVHNLHVSEGSKHRASSLAKDAMADLDSPLADAQQLPPPDLEPGITTLHAARHESMEMLDPKGFRKAAASLARV